MSRSGIITFLEKYGCPTHYNGYMELLQLLLVAGAATWCISKNLKCIYYDTARVVGTTRLCLERNMRTLVLAWSKRPGFEKLFNEIPTNAQLIARLAEIIPVENGYGREFNSKRDRDIDEYEFGAGASAFDLLLS